MHGLILTELKRFADERLGQAAWQGLMAEAGLEKRLYVASGKYPDAEVAALVNAVCRQTGLEAQDLLLQFGRFIAPTLMTEYKPFIKPEWRTLEMIEHTEEHIHRAVRLHDPSSAPPRLKVRRVNPVQVVILYDSKRKLCSVAKGIVQGVAEHYGDKVEITDLTCMLKGKPNCTIAVTLADPKPLGHESQPGA
jgi:hypothetical protein